MGGECSRRSWAQYFCFTVPIFIMFFGYYLLNTGEFKWSTRTIMDLAGLLSVALIASFLLTNIGRRQFDSDEEHLEPSVYFRADENRRNDLQGVYIPRLEPRDPIVTGDLNANDYLYDLPQPTVNVVNETRKISGKETAV